MQRMLIVGSAGAGKSTLSRAVADITHLPLVHLDAEFWQAGWRETPRAEWRVRVADLLQHDRWIMDGNYGGTLAERVNAADTVVVLALPRLQCLYRVLKRSLRWYGRTRSDMNPGCREHLPDCTFLKWIWLYPQTKLPAVLALLRAQGDGKTIAILRSSAEVSEFLATLRVTYGK